MPQKNTTETTRREAILAAALPLFLKNGYEKTSIRMIAANAKCEVGLVYYYFETKEEIFDLAVELYFEAQKTGLASLSARTEGDTALFFDEFFLYLEKEAPSIADTFRENVHWTVVCAVRTKFAELAEPHIMSALADLSSLPLSAGLAAKTIADVAVCAALSGELPAKKDELRRLTDLLIGAERVSSKRKDIPSFLL